MVGSDPPRSPTPHWHVTVTPPPVPVPPELSPDPGEPEGPARTGVWDTIPANTAWDTAFVLFAWAVAFVLPLARAAGGEMRLAEWGASLAPWPGLADAWRLLASTFLHATPLHLLSNVVAFASLGPSCARLFGRPGLWLLYAAGGAGASLVSLAWRSQLATPSASVGGSGVVFALGGAMGMAAWRLRSTLPPGRARALGGSLLLLLGSGLVAGLTREATDSAAHLGGIAIGACLGFLLPLRRPGRVSSPAWLRLLAIPAVLAAAFALGRGVWSGFTAP